MALFRSSKATQARSPLAQAEALEKQAQAAVKAERWQDAFSAFWDAGKVYADAGEALKAARCVLMVAHIVAMIGQPTQAREMLAACTPVFAIHNDLPSLARCAALEEAMKAPGYHSAE